MRNRQALGQSGGGSEGGGGSTQYGLWERARQTPVFCEHPAQEKRGGGGGDKTRALLSDVGRAWGNRQAEKLVGTKPLAAQGGQIGGTPKENSCSLCHDGREILEEHQKSRTKGKGKEKGRFPKELGGKGSGRGGLGGLGAP